MALMFPRLAHNFAKHGYYPTDTETLSRILMALAPADSAGTMRILDPCAGEGVALAECKHHLGNSNVKAYGIEYDEERAWHAKSLLDVCIHGDMQHCRLGQRSFGLLFLNPPYGDLVADKALTSAALKEDQGRLRLEKLFYQRTIHSLQWGGVLVLIIPVYSLDKQLSQWLVQHLDRIEVFLAPEQQYKQLVIFGVRKKVSDAVSTDVRQQLEQIIQGHQPPELPSVWSSLPYEVPASPSEPLFTSLSLDEKQLQQEIQKNSCLWPQFNQRFGQLKRTIRRPLMGLSNWHLALSLAAGQVSGVVQSSDDRTYVIKGDTYKEQQTYTTYQDNGDEGVVEITTKLDKFVPVIRALDLTPQSASFGQVLIIR